MADENLSFSIVFEEIERLVADVSRAGASMGSLGEMSRQASEGIAAAGTAATATADSLAGIEAAASDAAGALEGAAAAFEAIVEPQTVAVDSSEIEDAFEASARLREEIEQFSEPQTIPVDFAGVDEATAAFEEAFSSAQGLRAEIEAFESARTSVDAVKDSVDALGDSLGNAGAGAADAAQGISGAFGKAASALGGIAKVAAGSFLGFAAFSSLQKLGDAVANTFKKAAAEFIEAEQATVRLSSALGSLGQFSGSAVSDVRAFADEIARTTVFEDDAVVSAAALIAQIGRLSGTELQRATEAAVELSSVLGRDLNAAALLVARAAAGSTEALSRYGIVIDKTLPDSEKFAAVLKQVADNFGGRAQADAATFGGRIEDLTKSWDELLESFGRGLTVFQPVIAKLTTLIELANKAMGIEMPKNAADAVSALEGVEDQMRKAAEAAKVLEAIKPSDVDFFITANINAEQAIADVQRQIEAAKIAIQPSIVGGTEQQIADTLRRVGEVQKAAAETGNAEVIALANSLNVAVTRALALKAITIESQGVVEAKRNIDFLIDTLVELQGLGGATDLKIFDTSQLKEQGATLDSLTPKILAAVSAIEAAVNVAASTPGTDAPAKAATDALVVLRDAKKNFIDSFGTLPDDLAAIFDNALARLRAKAADFGVEIEIDVKPIDVIALEKSLVRGQIITREVQFEIRPDEVLNPLRQIQTEADKAALAIALIGTGINIDNITDAAAGAEEAIARILESKPNLEAGFQELSASAQGFQDATVSGFENAFSAIVIQGEGFKDAMGDIFKTLVDEAIRQLARLAALKVFEFALNLVLPGAGTVVATAAQPVILPSKAGPQKPVEIPLIPVLPADPIVVPLEAGPFTVPAIEIPPALLTLGFAPFEVPAVEIPEVPAIEIPPALVAINFAAVAPPDIEAPDVPPIEIEPLLATVEFAPIATPVIPAPDIPTITIAPELVGIEFAAFQVPTIEIPTELLPFDIPQALASVNVAPFEVPTATIPTVVEPFEIPQLVASVVFDAIDVPEITAAVEFGEFEPPDLVAGVEVAPFDPPVVFASLVFEPFELPTLTAPVEIAPFETPKAIIEATVAPFEVPPATAFVEIAPFEVPELTIAAAFAPIDIPSVTVSTIVEPFDIPSATIAAQFQPFEAPTIDIPTSVGPIDLPSFDPVPIEFAGQRFQGPAFDFESSALAFSRAINAPGAAEGAPRRELQPLRDVLPRPVNISITGAVNDGASVRRQLTTGALRSELERNLRRNSF